MLDPEFCWWIIENTIPTIPTISWEININIQYKMHQIHKLKCFSSHLSVAFTQSILAKC